MLSTIPHSLDATLVDNDEPDGMNTQLEGSDVGT